MVCMRNFIGLFIMLVGGLANCVCWGGSVLGAMGNVVGVVDWLLVIYLALNVRSGGCLVHGVGHY
jgi:hypothetical protein